MPYAIELNFDPATEDVVRKVWTDLRQAGLGSDQVDGGVPHVTLAIAETIDHEDLGLRLEPFAREQAALPVTLEFFGAFRNGVLFVAPVMTAELLAAHDAFHRRFRLHENAMSAWYKPDAWQPHCTLARGLSGAELARALEVAYKLILPVSGRLEQLSLVEFNPAKVLGSWGMQGGPAGGKA